MTSSEKFYRTVLPNGVRIISEKVDFVRSIAIGIWVNTGSIDEREDENGIAHFLEHLAFKGTINRSALDIALSIESLGGTINAFTGKDLTCYYARILDEHLEQAVDVLADLVLNSVFREEDIEHEKSIILEEIKEQEDTPSDLVQEYFLENLYPGHPYGRQILGIPENIKRFTRSDFERFIHLNYVANRIIITASGNVDHPKLVSLVEKYLAKALPRDGERKLQKFPKSEQYLFNYHKNISQTHICTGRVVFPYSDPRRYTLSILNVLLSGGMSSRLFQNIREKYGYVYSVYSFMELYKETGFLGIYVATDPDHVQNVLDLLNKEFRELTNGTISEDELKKVKAQFKGGTTLSLESMSARMSRLARMEIYSEELITVDEFLRRIERITLADLHDLCKFLFDTDPMITTILQPTK